MNMKTTKEVTVLGLGMMGTTLARLLLESGYHVTIWNRSPQKAAQLVEQGAILADTAAAAISASPIVVMCVYDYKAANEILFPGETAMAGKVLIQLTSGSPAEARESEVWAKQHSAEYIDGGIQAAPGQMGRPDTPILLSGAESAYRKSEDVLKVFGGNLTYLGEKIGAASAMDLATLSAIYGSVIGFFHGARIMESEGFPVDEYANVVAGITPSFGDFLKHEGHVIHSGDFTISESPLRISVEAVDRILQQANEARIHNGFPKYTAGLFKQAADAGYGGEELAALIKVLR